MAEPTFVLNSMRSTRTSLNRRTRCGRKHNTVGTVTTGVISVTTTSDAGTAQNSGTQTRLEHLRHLWQFAKTADKNSAGTVPDPHEGSYANRASSNEQYYFSSFLTAHLTTTASLSGPSRLTSLGNARNTVLTDQLKPSASILLSAWYCQCQS